MIDNKEKTRSGESVYGNIIAYQEELRKIAYKCFDRGYISLYDYTLICERNNQLIF